MGGNSSSSNGAGGKRSTSRKGPSYKGWGMGNQISRDRASWGRKGYGSKADSSIGGKGKGLSPAEPMESSSLQADTPAVSEQKEQGVLGSVSETVDKARRSISSSLGFSETQDFGLGPVSEADRRHAGLSPKQAATLGKRGVESIADARATAQTQEKGASIGEAAKSAIDEGIISGDVESPTGISVSAPSVLGKMGGTLLSFTSAISVPSPVTLGKAAYDAFGVVSAFSDLETLQKAKVIPTISKGPGPLRGTGTSAEEEFDSSTFDASLKTKLQKKTATLPQKSNKEEDVFLNPKRGFLSTVRTGYKPTRPPKIRRS